MSVDFSARAESRPTSHATPWSPGTPALAVHPAADTARADWCLRGELDLMTAPLLAGLVEQQVALGRSTLRLDLSGLSFCDVRGLGALHAAHRRCAEAGGALLVVDPPARLQHLADVAGLGEHLGLVPDVGPRGPVLPGRNSHRGHAALS